MLLELLADNAVSPEIGAPVANPNPVESGIMANDDLFSISEDLKLIGNVLSDNGNGEDVLPEGAQVHITAINDVSDYIGQDILLESGATLNVGIRGWVRFDPNGQYNWLAVGQTATETFTYTIQDELGQTSSATVVITVEGENDAPVVQNPLTVSMNEEEDIAFVSLISGSVDPDDDVLGTSDVTLISGDDSGITKIVDNLFVDPSAYRWLDPGESEVLKYQYGIVDGYGGETPQTATIIINGTSTGPELLNPVPNQQAQAYTPFEFEIPDNTFFSEDGSPIELSARLSEGQPLPAWLSFDPASNQLRGYATSAELGRTEIEITATDAEGDYERDTFNIGIALPLNSVTNKIEGDPLANRLDGTNANDHMNGKAGADTLWGYDGDDNLYGGSSIDVLYGNRGNDVLRGDNGDDILRAGDGNDLVVGGNHNDQLNGGLGNDTLEGGSGDDSLWGSQGDDVFILAQGGKDVITSGAGNDTFVLTPTSGESTIRDFSEGEDDFLLTQGLSFDDLSISQDAHGDINIEYQGRFSLSLTNVASIGSDSFKSL